MPSVARADDDEASASPANNEAAIALNKVLQVLQQDPSSASDACVDALKELHKTQDIVATDEARSKDQDLAVARDVLESDYEDATQICGADARTLCRTSSGKLPKLPPACAAIHAQP